jgi:hypothetical protein
MPWVSPKVGVDDSCLGVSLLAPGALPRCVTGQASLATPLTQALSRAFPIMAACAERPQVVPIGIVGRQAGRDVHDSRGRLRPYGQRHGRWPGVVQRNHWGTRGLQQPIIALLRFVQHSEQQGFPFLRGLGIVPSGLQFLPKGLELFAQDIYNDV